MIYYRRICEIMTVSGHASLPSDHGIIVKRPGPERPFESLFLKFFRCAQKMLPHVQGGEFNNTDSHSLALEMKRL